MKKLIILAFGICAMSCRDDEPRSLRQKLEDQMEHYEQQGFSGSILVAHKGDLLLRDGYGFSDKEKQIANTPETIFDFGSLTKQFTGAAIVKAETLGLLTVEQKLSDFFTNVPEGKANITLHQLLTHSAGFEDFLGDDYDLIGRNEFLDLALASKLKFAPGSGYSYSNVGYSLLGIVLEDVSGQTYESFLRAHLFNQAGLEATGYILLKNNSFQDQLAVGYRNGDLDGKPTEKPWMNDGPGWHLRANGGILTTVEEMYHWIRALNEKKVLDESALTKYLTPYVKEDEGSGYYSYGWVVDSGTLGQLYWHDGGNGIFSAVTCSFPETETIIIIASNDSTIDASDLVEDLIAIIGAP
ncbi:serine hydrolase domain-containing protein [Parachryseolinea silvisoli]|uniref:serine hydrolase domain-containing protein n=1 Tax=Parachryseolinea silvisoli TaxID=2873601 RepID=UPI0022658AAE|nr:serine hydrolase domain-containing protein [Parachryseolinea silvisoli]MCD9015323.1 beta-lactamase family protein [Parachryseolinea silvisoli]